MADIRLWPLGDMCGAVPMSVNDSRSYARI
jgi:hypothetical protein